MAVGDTYPEINGTRKIAIGRPTSDNSQAAWAALTWTTFRGITMMPRRGDSAQDTAEGTLDQGRTYHNPGQVDGGVLEIPFVFIEGDAGQSLIRATPKGTNVSVQEIDPDGTATFYHGKLMFVQRRESTTNSNKGYVFALGVNSERFEGVPDNT